MYNYTAKDKRKIKIKY